MKNEKITLQLPEKPIAPGKLALEGIEKGTLPEEMLLLAKSISKEDSFAACHDRLIQEKVLNNKIKISIYTKDSLSGSLEEVCNAINKEYQKTREEICQSLHDYLLKKNGIVTRWAYPQIPYENCFDVRGIKCRFSFQFFGENYRPAKNRLTIVNNPNNITFRNAYVYKKPRPSETASVYRVMNAFEKENHKELTHAAANSVLAKKHKEEISADHKKKKKAVFGLFLMIAIAIAFFNAMISSFTGADGMLNLMTAFKEWQTSSPMPGMIKNVLQVIAFIPLLIFNILLLLQGFLTSILQLFKEIHAGLYYIGVAAAFVAFFILLAAINKEFSCKNCKLKNGSYKKACQELKKCEKEESEARAAYDALVEQFKKTDVYLNAVKEDKKRIEEYELDKKQNERFALEWQKAWYNALIDQGISTGYRIS